ncbi:MAG: NADH-quinone oxidoreductase subunit N [Pseudomonadota bacterium]
MDIAYQSMLMPLILSAAILIIMMQIAFWRHATTSWILSCASLVAAMLSMAPVAETLPLQVTPLLLADQFSLFFSMLILFATLVTALLAKDYLQHRSGENEEFYLLLLLSALGAIILVSSTHLASFLLGMELLGVALYALIAYPERGHLPLEAATKYLILSGAASAILLFGFALIYAALGSLSFAEIGTRLAQVTEADKQVLVMVGSVMVIAGIGFKLSLVPFHMWTPDVYQGAPSPVTGYLATVSKGAIFAALMRLYVDARLYEHNALLLGLSLLAIASMLIGNFLALKQENVKRLLAYSSIAHIGYLLIALIVFGALQQPDLAIEAASFYLTAYVVTSLAAFALLSILSSQANLEVDDLQSMSGLFWRQPVLALLLTIAMLSLAGIPLTVGFIGKFYLFTVGIKGALWVLLAALVVGSGISIYYYLRVVFMMTTKATADAGEHGSGESGNDFPVVHYSLVAKSMVWLLILMILYLGVLPESFMGYLRGISL